MKRTKESPFLTATELAARWRVSHDTIQNWRVKGTGPPWVQLGPRRYLYRKTDVEKWESKRLQRIVMPLPRRRRPNALNPTGHPAPSKNCRNAVARERLIKTLEGDLVGGDE